MSHSPSPTDLGAGWTFVSSSAELNEEMQNAVSTGDMGITSERGIDPKTVANADVDKTEEVTNPSGVEELEDLSSESESLPSSDVDVLEENVGPDHEILEVSSSIHASTFSISPLEGLPEFCHSGSMNISPEVPETKEVDTITNQEPITMELSSLKHPKSLAEAAASAQLAQSSRVSDNSLLSEHKEEQQLIRKRNSTKIPDNLSPLESRELLQEQTQKFSKSSDNLSHLAPEEPLQEQVSEQKPVVKKQKPVKRSRKCHGRFLVPNVVLEMYDIVRELSSEMTSVLLYFLLWCVTIIVVMRILPGTGNLGHIALNADRELKFVQDETLRCLGLQHLTAVENNHYTMLLTNVCLNDSVAWKEMFERLLSDEVMKTLMHDVYRESSPEKKMELIEKFALYTSTDLQGIRFDLLILQMEHLGLFDSTEENVPKKEEHKDSVIPDLLSEKLGEQEEMLSQLHEFIERLKLANFALKSLDAELKMADSAEKHAELTELKPKVYRLELENAFLSYRLKHMLDEFENGEFLDPEYWLGSLNLSNALNNIGSSTVEELMDKVNYLLSSNDEIRRLYSHFSVMKQHLKDGDSKGTNSDEHTQSAETQIDNLKSLIEKLLGVHQSISGELHEVKK